MATIDDLISSIMGQTETALNAPQAPWQQELLESVNPEKVKRQNIARALAKASTQLATTPGNFLTGLSAAAATGADAYLTGRDQAEDQRLKVQQLLGMQAQKDQDRRLSLLMDALGVQRNQISDRNAEEDRQYNRTKDEREWGLRKSESDARTAYYNRKGTAEDVGSNAAIERRIGTATTTYYRELNALRERNGEEPTEEQANALWDDILKRYRIPEDWDSSAASVDNVSQSDLFTPRQATPAGGAGSPQVLTPDQYESGLPPVPAPNSTGAIVNAPPSAIDFLRKNPKYRDQFDQKYGAGAAAAILGQ